MKIWFGATSYKIEDYIDDYRRIRDYLVTRGHIVLFDWIDQAYAYKMSNPSGSRGIKNVYQKVTTAIGQAEACVIEYTVPNFSSSHQIMYSLLKRKPTLVMRLRSDNSFSDSYLDAIESPFLTVSQYDPKSYQDILGEFIGESRIEGGLARYNLVLDKKHKYYLDWISSKDQVSRSQVIRLALDSHIKKDKNYQKYLKIL